MQSSGMQMACRHIEPRTATDPGSLYACRGGKVRKWDKQGVMICPSGIVALLHNRKGKMGQKPCETANRTGLDFSAATVPVFYRFLLPGWERNPPAVVSGACPGLGSALAAARAPHTQPAAAALALRVPVAPRAASLAVVAAVQPQEGRDAHA